MQTATLLHNPSAGEESFTKDELVSYIQAQGFTCIYKSVQDDDWDKIDEGTDFLIIAGGDGTVRKVAERLLEKKLHKNYPLALLPAGTANNIARTLKVPDDQHETIRNWKNQSLVKFDAGKIYNLPQAGFFLESFGFGVFPLLMKEMKRQDGALLDTPEKKLKLATELLYEIISAYSPVYCELEIDGSDHSGEFFLVEIMNTRSIGPNLVLSPHAHTGDGEFEVVLIPESQKEKLVSYVKGKIEGLEEPDFFDICKAKNVKIKCDHFLAHVDDEIVEIGEANHVRVELIPGLLEFLNPAPGEQNNERDAAA